MGIKKLEIFRIKEHNDSKYGLWRIMQRIHFFEGKKIKNFHVQEHSQGRYECICLCGNIRYITGYDLSIERYSSCGCLRDEQNEQYENLFWEKFWKQVKKNKNGCLEWTGVNRNGYGRINYKRKTYTCTRLIWEKNKGKIKKKLVVCHKCDNPSCINIDHLFLGTKKENMQDSILKGRRYKVEGENNKSAKLKISDVIEIRKMMKEGRSAMEISKRFLVNVSTIRSIHNRKTWKDI